MTVIYGVSSPKDTSFLDIRPSIEILLLLPFR
jgi:hypothetical protein